MLKLIHLLGIPAFLWLGACGPAVERLPPAPTASLPAPPADTMVGDGAGRTEAEAITDARRVVVEQLNAHITTRTTWKATETNGQAHVHASTEVVSMAAFEFGELLETWAVIETAGGFRARVVLRRGPAQALLSDRIVHHQRALDVILAAIEGAMGSLDTAILLKRQYNLAAALANREAMTRTLVALGGQAPVGIEVGNPLPAELRRAALLRLQLVAPGLDPALRNKVAAAVRQAAATVGCTLTPAPVGPPEPGRPTADFRLVVAQRRWAERGLRWVDIELDLRAVDARTGHVVVEVAGGSHFGHAGGATEERAEHAVVRQVAEKLGGRLAEAGLDCR